MKIFRQISKAILGAVTVLVFFVLGFLWWIFDAMFLVPMWVLSLVIIVSYMICIVVYALCSSKETMVYRLPEIKSIQNVGDRYVFIVEKNELFCQGSYATICYQEGEKALEIVLGLGYVETINTAGYLQIIFEKIPSEEYAIEIYRKIEDTAFFRKAIKIKPSIDKKILQEVVNNG